MLAAIRPGPLLPRQTAEFSRRDEVIFMKAVYASYIVARI
jgi:hypothetical protein